MVLMTLFSKNQGNVALFTFFFLLSTCNLFSILTGLIEIKTDLIWFWDYDLADAFMSLKLSFPSKKM